jgi:hypothetical protein
MRRLWRVLVPLSLVTAVAFAPAQATASEGTWQFSEFTVSNDALCQMRDSMFDQMLATHEAGTWAPIEYQMTDADLARMGLPSKDVLLSRSYAEPTLVTRDGRFHEVPTAELEQAVQAAARPPRDGDGGSTAAGPTVTTYAGAGCLGIRPGAWVLLLSGGGIGWCSLAHVYGSAGSYDISTAGHCGRTGDTATVIAALGNRSGAEGAVLLDFGTFGTSHDNGLGNDWALIDIKAEYQGLVSPTMCFWGGPRGMYTKTGGVATVSFGGNPGVTVTPDPFLAQAVVHYGHGIGVGAGGTPRAGTSIHWGQTHFMFFGAISPGDSGSGANTLTGDSVGANMEAAGIMTHLYIDPLMRQGLGIMGGTRATAVNGTLANGQIVPYPAPAPGLP